MEITEVVRGLRLLCTLYCNSPASLGKPVIAQLAEHLTVDISQPSDGPWFDSGWPDFRLLAPLSSIFCCLRVLQAKNSGVAAGEAASVCLRDFGVHFVFCSR